MNNKEIVKALRRGLFSNKLLQIAADKIEEYESKINRLQAENERLKERLKESLIENAELLKCKFSADDVAQNIIRAKAEAYKEFTDNIEKAFSKTERQMPNSEVIKQTVQICRNAIQIALKELRGEDK